MEKRKIFLAGLLVLIAISGAIVTQAHTKSLTRFVQRPGGFCVPITSDDACTTGGTGCVSINGEQMYQDQLSSSTCINTLKN